MSKIVSGLGARLLSKIGAALVGFIQAGVGAIARTVQDELRERVSVKQFGAVGDGVTNDTAAIKAAKAGKGSAYVPEGTYLVDVGTSLSGLWGPGLILVGGVQIALPASFRSGKKNNVSPLVVNMHYGILKGTPFKAGEVFSGYPLGADVPAGATTIASTGPVPPAGILIQYLSKDGNRYVALVTSSDGVAKTYTLDSPVIGGIAVGPADWTNITNFYANNGPHPHQYGYQAIADYVKVKGLRAYKNLKTASPVAYNGGAVAKAAGNDVTKPGGATAPGWTVTPAGANQGCQAIFYPSKTGSHVVRIKVNTRGVDALLIVAISTSAGIFYFNNGNIKTSAPSLVEIPVWVSADAYVNVTLTRGATDFDIGDIEFAEFDDVTANDLNWGKHVCLGDSWFQQLGFCERLQANLPNALVVNKGVGGNKASDLVNRFAADVVPQQPDFVWIMVGTNDAAAPYSVDQFAYYIDQLKWLCQQIGATPIIFTASVGTISLNANYFDQSRQYADMVPYIAKDMRVRQGTWTPVPTGITLTGGATIKGTYTRVGNLVDCTITLSGNGGTHAAAANAYFKGLPFPMAENSVSIMSDQTNANLGTAQVYQPDNRCYVQPWAASAGVTTIRFSYRAQ